VNTHRCALLINEISSTATNSENQPGQHLVNNALGQVVNDSKEASLMCIKRLGKVDGSVRYRPSDIAAWLDARTHQPEAKLTGGAA
jgi:hypothetical protein